ncbi:dolichol-p-glucose synthetase [Vibrio ishigakensis]|uniref:Dolichol-p-glucose synthetase n=1 Tax=Vibrio ishigakensis TaxID=1481914 RepID=A0A0B8QTS5_9VIBR|nr:dolichol-p-glucose synthetase [Vibrio ishigakensis]
MNSLRAGNELVMGNRFEGGIADGAMPFLHKYLGNPILSFLGRLFFNIPCKDFHCGLRGFERQKALSLNLHTTGMEFASEMVVKSALKGLKIDEVPTTLSPDGRTGAPHLNTWRDGWRHLCFLLLYTPKWLFFYPSLFLFMFGLVLTSGLFFDGVTIGNVEFSNNTFYAGCLSLLISIQAMTMGSIVRKYAHKKGFLPKHNYTFLDRVSLEHSALLPLP